MEVLFEGADLTKLFNPTSPNTLIKEILAHWNVDQDPLFGDRASSTTITLLIQSGDAEGIQEGTQFERKPGERYKALEIAPTCGDGFLTTVRVARANP